jgi:PAS domain S-box-containing protein
MLLKKVTRDGSGGLDMGISIENLCEGISEGVFVYTIDRNTDSGCYSIWNKKITEITGCTLEEVNESRMDKCTSQVNFLNKKLQEWVRKLNAGETNVKEELELVNRSGERRIIFARPTLQEDEEAKYVIVIIRDITEEKELQKELSGHTESYKRLLELSLEAVCIHDGKRITWVNAAGAELIGAESPESLIGHDFMGFLHGDYHEAVKHRIKEVKESSQTAPFLKEKIIKFDGSIVNVEIATTRIPVGGEYQYLAVVRDITPKVRMEEALRKSELKFREVFNNTSDGLMISKYEANGLLSRFIDVNAAVCRMFGYTREELCCMYPIDMNPAAPEDMIYEMQKKIKNEGTACFQAEFCTKSGTKLPVEVNCTLIKLENEEIVLSVLHDLTERINNERKLRKSKDRYRWLLDNIPYAIYVQDKDTFVFSNRIGLEYFGLTDYKDIIGKKCYEIIVPHPDYKDKYKDYLKILGSGADLPPHEAKFLRLSDNKILDLETTIIDFPFYEEGNKLIITKDISERKRAEELQKAMDEKIKQLIQAFEYEKFRTEFFANISHELRTPINVIFSSLQLLKVKLQEVENLPDSLKMEKHIEVMKQNCYRLIRLINNLIDVTKIDSGYFEINLSNHNIVNIVEDIALSVAEYAENKGITLIFDTETEEKIISCDPDKIERIILNLISNAVKFTEPGGNIDISIIDKSASVIIKVKDDGIGIPNDKQTMIFNRFVQVDKSLTRAREGSGIGLSLVKSLVEMHGGSISLVSEWGKGSEFTVELPVGNLNDSGELAAKEDHNIQCKIEKINIEFSDIYF